MEREERKWGEEEEEVVEAEGEKRDTYADFYHDITTITNLEVQFKL